MTTTEPIRRSEMKPLHAVHEVFEITNRLIKESWNGEYATVDISDITEKHGEFDMDRLIIAYQLAGWFVYPYCDNFDDISVTINKIKFY